MKNTNNHAFVTLAQSGEFTKEELLEGLVAAGGLEGALLVAEVHGDEGAHLHGVIWGEFRNDRYTKALHRALPDRHVNVLFRHPGQGGRKYGAVWPLVGMVKYVTNPAKDKVVDTSPLVWVQGRTDPSVSDFTDDYLEKFLPKSLAEKLQQAEQLKSNGGLLSEAIVMAAEQITKDNAHDFNIVIQYFKSLPQAPLKITPEGETPRGWQELIIDWALAPCPTGTNNRGLWLRMPSGAGKTWVLNYISDNIEGGVFRPGFRPDGSFDPVSLLRYNGEALILFDDIGATVKELENGNTKTLWKNKTMDLFKMVANNTPIPIDFGGEHREIMIVGKVLITSNFGLPEGRNAEDGAAIRRRYIELCMTDLDRLRTALTGTETAAETAVDTGRGAWN
jgi:hypothetical protein